MAFCRFTCGELTRRFPKGSTILKSRDVGASVGRFVTYEELEEMTRGMARAEAYRLIATRLRHDIVNLRDRTNEKFDAKALREQWKADRRSERARIESGDEEFVAAEA